MNSFFHPLPRHSFSVVSIDPPWRFRTWSETNQEKSASKHYDLMQLRQIESMPVRQLAKEDCIVLLWATAPLLPEAVDCLRGWGVDYRSNIIWRKTTEAGKVRPGLGWWARSMHEQVLIGTVGSPFKIFRQAFPSIFDGVAREHSRKPEEYYRLVEERTPGVRRADIFARSTRRGWHSFGHETTKFDKRD